MADLIVICKCGSVIPNTEISYSNGTNEEGEEFAEVYADCPVCKISYEGNQWGHIENEEEAAQCLIDYIKENY